MKYKNAVPDWKTFGQSFSSQLIRYFSMETLMDDAPLKGESLIGQVTKELNREEDFFNCLRIDIANYCLFPREFILNVKVCPGSYIIEFQESQMDCSDIGLYGQEESKPSKGVSKGTRLLLKTLILLLKTQGEKCVYYQPAPVYIKG